MRNFHKKEELEKLSLKYEDTPRVLYNFIEVLYKTDLNSDVLIVYKGSLRYYLSYIEEIAKILRYNIKLINETQILVDNGFKITFINEGLFRSNYNYLLRGYRNLYTIFI